MQKRILPITSLKEGMLLGEDVVNSNGVVIMQQGAKLNDELIEKIAKFHYAQNVYVFTKETKQKDIDQNLENLMRVYEEEKKKEERRLKRRKTYASQIEELSLRLKESIFIENIESKSFNRELNHIIFDLKKLATDYYNIFSVILSDGNVENYLYEHTIRSTIISFLLGKWMGITNDQLNLLVKASLLKDIGKVKTPKNILVKPEKLTANEFKEIKKHPLYSYAIIKDIENMEKAVCEAILQHHEREDGSGYPLGIKGQEISQLARIMTIGDMFTAMTTKRVYAEKISPFKVLNEFQQSAFDKLHMGVVMTFIKNFSEYYLNAEVKLSDNRKGHIIRLDLAEINKPLIKLTDGNFIDLKKERSIEITDVIDKLFND